MALDGEEEEGMWDAGFRGLSIPAILNQLFLSLINVTPACGEWPLEGAMAPRTVNLAWIPEDPEKEHLTLSCIS